MLITTTIDAEPDHREDLATESIIPLLMALATGYFWLGGGIFNPWNAVWGAIAGTVILFVWFWTSSHSKQRPQRRHGRLATT